MANLVYELPHEFPNYLRLRILANKEILGKPQIWVETQPSAQSPLQKVNFGSSSQKTLKSRHQTFLVRSSSTGFLHPPPPPNTPPRTADAPLGIINESNPALSAAKMYPPCRHPLPFTHCSVVCTADSEQVNAGWVVVTRNE